VQSHDVNTSCVIAHRVHNNADSARINYNETQQTKSGPGGRKRAVPSYYVFYLPGRGVQDDVDGVDDARNVSKQRQHNVQQEVALSNSDVQAHSQGWEKHSCNNLQDSLA
jgi:hypothetical protein